MRKCVFCDNKYIPKNKQQKYCNIKCHKLSYYYKHRDEAITRMRKYDLENKEKAKEKNKNQTTTGIKCFYAIKARCNNTQNVAYKNYGAKGVKFLFSRDEFLKYYFSKNKCEICGIRLNDNNRWSYDGRSIHRNNDKGDYCFGNVMIVCRKCNTLEGKK